MSKAASKRGLTLIEVLLALVILSVGVSSMMMAMSRCLAVVRTARNREVARSLLRRIDIENPIDKKEIEELSETGDFEEEELEGYTWHREIMMEDEDERPGLFRITSKVQWSERGRDAFEEISMYTYAPNAKILTEEF